ncbi:MAG: LD-carboxypeptidase [Desulfobulbaceae bacterium]|nr:LD-carboxypeptidase [Desulfobulbaceae bacterium]
MIIPAKLHSGSCIGIFSPAGPVRDHAKVESGIRLLREMGFRIKLFPHPEPEAEYLAADDRRRVDEFHSMLADDDVNALMALRGGYGCLRITEMLNYELIKARKKFIIGFSDISILLNTISSRAHIATVHGPVLTSLASTDKTSTMSLLSLLKEGLPEQIAADNIVILRAGDATGILRGGNLATLVHLLGTPWEIPWNNTLLLLEDTGEPMYKIDRMLTQLYHSGKLKKLSGIILGSFDTGDDTDENNRLQKLVWQRVMELTEGSPCPVWGNFPAGHRERNLAVPLGVEMFMDSGSATLLLSNTEHST